MGLFDGLMRAIGRQPAVGAAWLRDHLARIAPVAGLAAPTGTELQLLLDELDRWARELYHNPQDPDFWRRTLEQWRAITSREAMAAAMARFGDTKWIHAESSRRFDTSGGERGLGLGMLHDEFVRAGLIPGPCIIESELRPVQTYNGDGS